jgi:hypothetical protein
MALDLLEPIRPHVERYLLQLLHERPLTTNDFFQSRRGPLRLLRPLTHELATTMPAWAALLAPIAERVADMFAASPGAQIGELATPLNQTRRSAARQATRKKRQRSAPSIPPVARACATCGGMLTNRDRRHCTECLPAAQAEQRSEFAQAGPAALAELRAQGHDPAHGGQAAARRSATLVHRHAQARAWAEQGSAPTDPDHFRREILPVIQTVPLRALAAASGLSLRYCALIRSGQRVPHARHWPQLQAVGPS